MSDKNLRKVEYKQTEKGTIPVYADEIIDGQNITYSTDDHRVWRTLFQRQIEYIKQKACSPYNDCLKEISFTKESIPDLNQINKMLFDKNKWNVITVNGLLSDVVFFNQLSKRKFPVTWWIRSKEKLNYIQEPDIFHDLFGHVPLLLNSSYADVMRKFGEVGSGKHSENPVFMEKLARLYWFTVEFGLMKEGDELKIFGAGLLSSQGEIAHALGDESKKVNLKLNKIINTPYQIDSYQPLYFVLKDFDEIQDAIDGLVDKFN